MNEFKRFREFMKGKKTWIPIALGVMVLCLENQGILTNIEADEYMSWIQAGGAATLAAKAQRLVQYVYASVPT